MAAAQTETSNARESALFLKSLSSFVHKIKKKILNKKYFINIRFFRSTPVKCTSGIPILWNSNKLMLLKVTGFSVFLIYIKSYTPRW
jgi:hypothetical protein